MVKRLWRDRLTIPNPPPWRLFRLAEKECDSGTHQRQDGEHPERGIDVPVDVVGDSVGECANRGPDDTHHLADALDAAEVFAAEKSLSYTFLSDTDSTTIDAFGLRNEDVTAGSRFDGIPHPAIVYIRADGEVAGVQKEEGYKDRPPTEGIPQLVSLINQGAPIAQ